MSKLIYVKEYKRGAYHDDGSTFTCITCRIEKKLGNRGRANQAVVTAIRVNGGYKIPLGWCETHIPQEVNI